MLLMKKLPFAGTSVVREVDESRAAASRKMWWVTCRVLGNVFASMRLFHFEVPT